MRFGATRKGKAVHIIRDEKSDYIQYRSYCGLAVRFIKDIPPTTGDWLLHLEGLKGFSVGDYGNACEVCVAGVVRHG